MTSALDMSARAGAVLERARAVLVLLHGRGGRAENMLTLGEALSERDVAYVAPEAPMRSWYPLSFLAPLDQNEPHLSIALKTVGEVVRGLKEKGVPQERIFLVGFSQGACLALEYAARNAGRFGGVAAMSGGLIGPQGTPRTYAGSMAGTPVFLGSSDIDPHIPLERVHESARVFERLGADVTERIFPGMGHTIVEEEIRALKAMIDGRRTLEETSAGIRTLANSSSSNAQKPDDPIEPQRCEDG